MSNHTDLMNSLNNAIAYSWVLGWYAGRDGKTTYSGKIQDTEDIKAKHPDIVRVIESQSELLEACKGLMKYISPMAEELSLDADESVWAYINDAADAIAKATE